MAHRVLNSQEHVNAFSINHVYDAGTTSPLLSALAKQSRPSRQHLAELRRRRTVMHRRSALAVAIGLALGLSTHRPAAQTLAEPTHKEVSSQSLLALELLHGLYPELLEKALSLQLEGAGS